MTTTARRVPLLALALLVVLGAAFVLRNACDLDLPFGQSDEGLNAAVWGEGSRSYRELGPIESVFGGRRIDGRAYATHPPFLLTATAATETVAGEHRWATRAPAWLGALASIPLLYVLLRRLRVAPAVAAAAVVAGLGTPMFFVYGWMLDTPVVAFPLAVAAAAVWLAPGRDRRHLVAAVAISVLVGLAGWQASLFVLLLGLWSLVVGRRAGRSGAEALPWLGGVATGLALSLAWCWWVYGDLRTLWEKFTLRTGGEHRGLLDMVTYQGRWTAVLLGVGLAGLVGSLVALRDQRFRALTACALASVVLYDLLFRSAASAHPFWNYQVLLAVVLGWGYLLERLHAVLTRDGLPASAMVVAGACVVAALGIVPDSSARAAIRAGATPVPLLQAAVAPTQATIGYLGDLTMPDDWILYELRRPARALDEPGLRALATQAPGDVVLVSGPCRVGDAVCAAIWRDVPGQDGYEVLTGAEAVRRLDAAR